MAKSFNDQPVVTRSRLHQQSGVALVVALILLVLVTLVGLAAIRGTTMQQQMTSNFFDRETAFQSDEAALRVAESWVQNNPTSASIRDCSPASANPCQGNPFTDTNQTGVTIQTVTSGQYSAGSLASGQPQFVVENMGAFTDPNASVKQLSGCSTYGGCGSGASATYYRITARSDSPANAGGRSIVTLQSMFKL